MVCVPGSKAVRATTTDNSPRFDFDFGLFWQKGPGTLAPGLYVNLRVAILALAALTFDDFSADTSFRFKVLSM